MKGKKQHFGQPCEVAGCERAAEKRFLCNLHYQRWRVGRLNPDVPPRTGPAPRISNGYREIFMPTHPLARADGYVAEHRLVVYNAGIVIPPGYHVHHINGVKLDNRLENLEVIEAGRHHWEHCNAPGALFKNGCGEAFPRNTGTCKEDGCDRPARTGGLCGMHYQRLQKAKKRAALGVAR